MPDTLPPASPRSEHRPRGRRRRRVIGLAAGAAVLAATGLIVSSTAGAAPAPKARQWATVAGSGFQVPVLLGRGPSATLAEPTGAPVTTAGNDFVVRYTGFTPQAKAAFELALKNWSRVLDIKVPIHVDATFSDLGPGVGGAAGPETFYTDGSTLYPAALGNQLIGADLDPSTVEIDADFSSTAPFHFGTSRAPRGTYDFTSVVMHEIGHGLGFLGLEDYDPATGVGRVGIPVDRRLQPSTYDRFVQTGSGVPVLSLPNPSRTLGQALVGNDLWFSGPATNAASPDGGRARLYAPAGYQLGSSYSHLDEGTYAAGTLNALMTPGIRDGETIRRPGPLALGILVDQGYALERGALASNALTLTSLCSPDPARARTWRVRNATGTAIPFRWDVYGTGTGTGTARPGDSTFSTPATTGPNTVRLLVDGVPITVKASSGATC